MSRIDTNAGHHLRIPSMRFSPYLSHRAQSHNFRSADKTGNPAFQPAKVVLKTTV